MKASESHRPQALGFISVISCESLGWVGGYLIVNPQGRPLEFHCTVPVAPNRAQEILYGVTFAPFFFGEVIGQALLKRSKTTPQIVITNHPQVLAAREFHALPLLYLPNPPGGLEASSAIDSSATQADSKAPLSDAATAHPLGLATLAGEQADQADEEQVADTASQSSSTLSLPPSNDILSLPQTMGTVDLLPLLTPHPDFLADQQLACDLLNQLPTSWTLTEPFERIEQAVREAQRAA